MKLIESIFESFLWNSRLMVLAAVLASLAAAVAALYMVSVDAWIMISHLGEYISPDLSAVDRAKLRSTTVTHIVEIIDGYLLATVLLIFALGLYELFISKIEQASTSESASRILVIRNLDDLKSRLAKVILMILIVKYFEHALNMQFKDPKDLLYFAGGIALLGLALYLSHAAEHKPDH
ncbi:MAG TPA: YqhA family protein [Leucothrix sp.]|nr:YqhA family protein [Leucothrix sp.]